MQYKLIALQNNLDRLKMSFQNEVTKLQNEYNLALKKYEISEEELKSKSKQKIGEKENEIMYLKKENEELKSENFNLMKQLEELKEVSKHFGEITSIVKNGVEQLTDRVRLTVMRAPTDNERHIVMKWYKQYRPVSRTAILMKVS